MLRSLGGTWRRFAVLGRDLRLQLGLAFAVALILPSIAAFIAVREFGRIDAAGADLDPGELQEVRIVGQIQTEIAMRADWLTAGLANGGVFPPPRTDAVPVEGLLEEYAALHTEAWPPGETDLYDRLVRHYAHLAELDDQIVTLASAGQLAQAQQLEDGEELAARRVVMTDVDAVAEFETRTAINTWSRVERTTSEGRRRVIAVALAMLGAGAVASALAIVIVRAPLRRLARAVDAVAAGDLTQRIDMSWSGEAGAISRSLERLRMRSQAALVREALDAERWQGLLAGVSDAVFALDNGGTVRDANGAARSVLGGRDPRGAPIGALLWRVRGDDMEPFEPREDDAGAELTVTTNPGRPGCAVMTGTLRYSGSDGGDGAAYVLVLRDTSATRPPAEFIDALTRELKRPITNLGIATELYRQEVDTLPDRHPARDLCRILESETARVRTLVENLLTAARFEAGEADLEASTTPVSELLSDALNAYVTPGEPERRLHIVCGSETVFVDPMAARLVVHHLLGAAFERAPRGEPLTIRVDLREPDVVIAAEASARGTELVCEQASPRSLDDARGAAHYGLGSGWYLATRLAAALGGSLDATQPGDGTTRFTAVLPAGAPVATRTGQGAYAGVE